MSYIEQTRDWTEQERLEWVSINSWVPEYDIEYKKKCCDDCAFFSPIDEGYADGFCMKNISNELGGEFIIDSGTFYCSYHKFKV